MMSFLYKHAFLTTLLLSVTCTHLYAGDLDGDIKIENDMEKYDSIDQANINVQYIKRKAKASAGSGSTYDGDGDLAIGGVINNPGAEIGDVTIIFDGEDISAVME